MSITLLDPLAMGILFILALCGLISVFVGLRKFSDEIDRLSDRVTTLENPPNFIIMDYTPEEKESLKKLVAAWLENTIKVK